ncbi:MAG: response regulator transcription factor [Chitinophagales bacterium]
MPINVIIYEDNNFLRESLSSLITNAEGFELSAAYENCNEVEAQVDVLKPNVVLMDIEMAGVNGIEGLKIIRKKFPEVNVLMLTVFEDNDRVFEAICAGATGYLLKKTPPARILDAIRDIVEGGAPMTSSIARKVLQLFPRQPARSEEIDKLTHREQQVLQLLVNGYSYKMIASELKVTLETIRTYIKRMYEKLRVHSVTEAINKAFPDRKI